MTGRPAGRPLSRRHALRLAGAGLTGMLVGCGGDAARPAGDATLPTAGSGASPGTAGVLADRLAGYRSAYRFVRTNTMAYDDEAASARATVAMRVEIAAFLAWARDNGHPDIRPALPRVPAGEEYLLDPLIGNDESLDTTPLAGTRQPFGRLIPDAETVKSYPATRQAGFALTMLKVLLSRAEHARLVTDSPLVRAAGGKSIITIYPFSAPEPKGGDSYLVLLPGVRDAFRADPALRWLVANPGQAMSGESQRRLVEGGGTLYTAEGYRVVYIDSARAEDVPALVAGALYEALWTVREG
ncbi:hypothetical protein [Micromonospora sp. NPDC001898]|uniref:hypothetical protein n=1 Tax=Micromonospora sp. NPDC001898 TaxID=3364221 RepID=UPI00369CBE9F